MSVVGVTVTAMFNEARIDENEGEGEGGQLKCKVCGEGDYMIARQPRKNRYIY